MSTATYDPVTDHEAPMLIQRAVRAVAFDAEEIFAVPGLSCGARGLALMAAVLGYIPTPEEVAAVTGDPVTRIKAWMKELHGTDYLYWEG